MRLVIDMNLGPAWVPFLASQGHDGVHWTSVGDPRAPDNEIVRWALANGAVILTADLDFGAILALSGTHGPSIILLRVQDTLPEAIGAMVVAHLSAHAETLASGAIVTIDTAAARVRILPIRGH